ncbi:Trp biosynthesis-associated membrane protein [Phytoactinopolyspora halophila]|uniref:Trp biosynthesis-associated membrane protein n=1 Tax=Phytoactinopolyspora halophila TaxID=1981511 RepID=UPI0013149CFE|nr:Trp biosynthesis-associated membrane protein [Phytoactinopolyspora halophila]
MTDLAARHRRAARRECLATLGALVLGSGTGLWGATRTWATAEVPATLMRTTVEVTGSDLVPLASAVCLVGLAAVVLVPAVRRMGRRIVGAVLALLGSVLLVNVLVVAADVDGRAARWIERGGEGSGPVDTLSTSPGWVVPTAAGAALMVAAGVLVALRGHRWPAMGRRYERTGRTGRTGRAGRTDQMDRMDRTDQAGRADGSGNADRADHASHPDRRAQLGGGQAVTEGDGEAGSSAAVWDALDRGDDPTA